MRARRALALIAAATVLLGAPAANAVAAPPGSATAPSLFAAVSQLPDELALLGQGSGTFGSPSTPPLLEIKFTNHDGYRVTVVASGQTVALSVASGPAPRGGPGVPLGVGAGETTERSSITTYLAHGRVTPTSIQASFGDRGRIDLHFHPLDRSVHASKDVGCRRPSGKVVARLGFFVGELRFRGEGGFTSAELHRVLGGSVDFRALVACLLRGRSSSGLALLPSAERSALFAPTGAVDVPAVPTHPSRGPRPTTLAAERKLPVSRTIFMARSRASEVQYLALSTASEGSIAVVRFALASAPLPSFSFDDALAAAKVSPPAPFSGSGSFEHASGDAKSWTGPLAVSFLGAPRFLLTGEGFVPKLSRGW